MSDTVTVRIGGPDAALRLSRALADPRGALVSIGAAVAAQGRKAFEDQRLGPAIWPERYPKQREPFINIVPVVRKAGEGRRPTPDDFRRRPALGGVDSELAQSIAFSVAGRTVEIGSTHPDAGRAQFGGASQIQITDTTRATLAEWLGIGTATGRAARKERRAGKMQTEGTGDEYGAKLAFVFNPKKTQFGATQAARPFVGFTDETLEDVKGELPKWLEGATA